MLMRKGKKWALSCVAISAVVLTGISANNVKADEVPSTTDSAATAQSAGNQNSIDSKNNSVQSQSAGNQNSIDGENTSVQSTQSTGNQKQNTLVKSENNNVQDGKTIQKDFGQEEPNNPLGYASNFHIFANEASLNAHTNGNVVAGNLYGNVNFGTNIINSSESHVDTDISYIQNVHNLANSSFVSKTDSRYNKVIFGVNNDVKLGNESGDGNEKYPSVNNIKIDHLDNDEIYQDKGSNVYIDISKYLEKLEGNSQNLADSHITANISNDNFPDRNQRVINLEEFEPTNNKIIISLDKESLEMDTPITIAGLSSDKGGTSVIINVDSKGEAPININSQIKLIFNDGIGGNNKERPNQETEYFDDNHLLWNFYDSTTSNNQYAGDIEINRPFQGSILAPDATINIHHNLDGNIVADKVNVQGGETHRWDLQDNSDIETEFEKPVTIPGEVDWLPGEPDQPDENDGSNIDEPDENEEKDIDDNGNLVDPKEPDENTNEGNEGTDPEEPDENNNNGNEGNEGTEPEEPDENTNGGNEGTDPKEPDTDKDDEDEDSESGEETGSENEDNESEDKDSEENGDGNLITNGGSEGNSENSNDSSELGEGVLPDVVGSDKNESQTPANDSSDNAAKLPQTGATSGVLATISGILLIVLGFLLKGIKPRKD
ncbi:LPXTG cell wall anchor domain-containing protein [Companilactobacillus suantsaicola]|uniref:LPXTG cell wall anchor domain-containing protein n=1 Tax=Companilactobacillus suantsaicola TaxID=2487723 RepID=A0A4Z0JKC7_9LACO|nr:collagen-binding domain-containing protein [Companilactobacillus suantsaicola]TGD23522.1 LPXTG cell wall anchor domain-containing protein [Companilactobacillus suantsaicola]